MSIFAHLPAKAKHMYKIFDWNILFFLSNSGMVYPPKKIGAPPLTYLSNFT